MQLAAAAVTPPAEHAARRPAWAAGAAAADASVSLDHEMMRLFFAILIILAALAAGSPQFAEADGSNSLQRQRRIHGEIQQEGTRIEIQHPDVGRLVLEQRPLSIKGDSIIMVPELLLFGNDPEIRIKPWFPNKYPNPFCPRSSVDFINLVPDTLSITILRDGVIHPIEIYREHIDRGRYSIRIMLKDSLPAGRYLIDVSVGDEKKRVKKVLLK